MIALLLAGMTLLVFLSRYLFLEPRLPISLGPRLRQLMAFSTPAVLAAIISPMVFVENQEFVTALDNPYLLGTLCAVILIVLTRNTLITTIVSMAVFALIKTLGAG